MFLLQAAFLTGLVDQDVVTASSRSSLKSMSEESPGTQLVSRHCFILEDPPNDVRSSPAPERSAIYAFKIKVRMAEMPNLMIFINAVLLLPLAI